MNDFKLDSRPNIKSGFIAPDGYFDGLTDKVMLSLPLKEVKVVPLYKRRPIWVTSAAAAFVLSFSLLMTKKEAVKPVMPDNKAIEKYVVSNSNISSYDLLQNLSEKDLRELQESAITVDDESIENYLSNEDVHLYQ